MPGHPHHLPAVLVLAALLLTAWPGDGTAAGAPSAPLSPQQKVYQLLSELIGGKVQLTLTDSSTVQGKLLAVGVDRLTLRPAGTDREVTYPVERILTAKQPNNGKIGRWIAYGAIYLGTLIFVSFFVLTAHEG